MNTNDDDNISNYNHNVVVVVERGGGVEWDFIKIKRRLYLVRQKRNGQQKWNVALTLKVPSTRGYDAAL